MRDIKLGPLEAACHPPHSVMLARLGCFVLCVLPRLCFGVLVYLLLADTVPSRAFGSNTGGAYPARQLVQRAAFTPLGLLVHAAGAR